MSDCTAIALLLGACSLALWAGAFRLVRTRSDTLTTCFVAAFAVFSTLMAAGPMMAPGT